MRSATRLVCRLAWRNLRRRPWQALLLLIALCLAATSLSLALAIRQTGDRGWDRVWRATNAGHVRAALYLRPDLPAPDSTALAQARQRLTDLTHAPGVQAAGPLVPQLFTNGRIGTTQLDFILFVREPTRAAVGQPLVTSGQWLDDRDSVVLEDGLASTLHVKPGDTITIAGRPLTVRGSALTVAAGRYPFYQPGRAWITPATAEKLRTAGAEEFAVTVELRLAKPDDANAFVATHAAADPQSTLQPQLDTWLQIRDSSHDELTTFAIALLTIGTLLGALTVTTAGVLVAGRMAAQIRQVGTLKAVGVTPAQVTGVVLAEYLTLAGLAAAIGIPLGTLLSPLLARNAPSLYGPPQTPPITPSRAAIVLAVLVAVVVLASVRPALRGVRQSTIRSLAASARPPRRSSRLAATVGWLGVPVPLVLGLRSALRRPARTIINAAGLALAVALVVAALALDDGITRFLATRPPTSADAAGRATEQALIDQLQTIVYAAAALLIALAAVNAVVVAILAARDNARNHAILRAVGATPRQTGTAFLIAQLGACLLACATGIPLGIALFNGLAGDDLAPARLQPLTYAAIAGMTIVLYALIVVVPARLLAAQPVAPQLAYE